FFTFLKLLGRASIMLCDGSIGCGLVIGCSLSILTRLNLKNCPNRNAPNYLCSTATCGLVFTNISHKRARMSHFCAGRWNEFVLIGNMLRERLPRIPSQNRGG